MKDRHFIFLFEPLFPAPGKTRFLFEPLFILPLGKLSHSDQNSDKFFFLLSKSTFQEVVTETLFSLCLKPDKCEAILKILVTFSFEASQRVFLLSRLFRDESFQGFFETTSTGLKHTCIDFICYK